MPQPGRQWYQVILNTRCSWLHGDPRGFRSKNHRIHSSGDYKHRPPQGEHAGLYRYHQERGGKPIRIPKDLFPVIGKRLVSKIESQGHRLLAVSLDPHHVHLLVELPGDRKSIRKIVGTWKQAASHAIRERLPGKIWAEDCDPESMKDRNHQRNTFFYILRHGQKDAWTWDYREHET